MLRLWEGLGYYRRARQLHLAARQIVAEHGGVFPRDPEAVRRLPGIGRYTAGAILSIAFDARQPILEANTTRLLCRLVAYRGDPASAPGQKLLWAAAEAVLPRRGVGRFNQALMELGSMVCVPRGPRCGECPVASLCRAHELGIEAQVPALKPKPPAIARREAAVVVRRGGRVLLVRCPEGQRWAGLWDFPRFAVQSSDTSDAPGRRTTAPRTRGKRPPPDGHCHPAARTPRDNPTWRHPVPHHPGMLHGRLPPGQRRSPRHRRRPLGL